MKEQEVIPPDTKEKESGPIVNITINGVSKPIHRGSQLVSEIKQLGNVPLADDLNQLIDGKLVPLPDDGRVTIKGDEVFISQPKSGGSSHAGLA